MGGHSVKDQVNVRLSERAISILYALQDHYGLSQAAIFELLLRDKANDMNLKVNELVHRPTGTAARNARGKARGAGTAKQSKR